MILSGQSIRRCHIFTPFFERTTAKGMTFGLGPAGYDVRIAEDRRILPGGFCLASTVEHFRIPSHILGIVHDKSTWARMGLTVQNTVIEPGWRGFLTLELANHSQDIINIEAGSPIAQIVFHLLDLPAENPYSGKYQDQPAGTVSAILAPGIEARSDATRSGAAEGESPVGEAEAPTSDLQTLSPGTSAGEAREATLRPIITPEAIEAVAQHLHDEELDHESGWTWPEHAKDDGYRGRGGYVTVTPTDIQFRRRESAKRILICAQQIAARTTSTGA